MRHYPQHIRITAVLVLFVLLTEFSGCTTTRQISSAEIKPNDKNIIRAVNLAYTVDSVVISGAVLTGKLDVDNTDFRKKIDNEIYASSDSAWVVDGRIIRLPIERIVKVERSGPDPDANRKVIRTVLIVTGVAVVSSAILMGVAIKGTVEIFEDMASMCSGY